jgi:integrase
LKRLHSWQKDVTALSFETTLESRVQHLLFRFSDGHQPRSLVGTLRRLMRDSGMAFDANGDNRTLYSLRHTCATLKMLRGEVDIHLPSKQMGNSAKMIERLA